MLKYLIHRLLIMVPTLLVVSFLIFAIIQAPPGDFLTTIIDECISHGQTGCQAKVEFLKQQYHLDRPFVVQYGFWIFGMLHGDLGYSLLYEQPVRLVVGDRLWLTVIVTLSTVLFTWIVAFPIGVYSATHQYSLSDYVVTFLGILGLAVPSFLLALVLLHFANVYFGLSIGGLMDAEYIDQPWTWGKIRSVLQHLLIPTIVIGSSGTAGMIRRLRANLLDELHKQYVVTARAKGMSPTRLLIKYPLRMSLNPFISDVGTLLPELVSGAVVVSVVMSLPTTGPMLLDALRAQDMYLAGSFLIFLAFLTVIGVLLSDIALAMLDPRIRLGGAATK
ncbi:MAG: ABC transporter permease [Dongiaceae bacterium]